ncbi:LysR family transcriptional regulator [Vibrio maerlii]|uniref:LysR family transcriptional regulator n=1 Tax=Vibrio maerlii TaxID=2231648 RepID=UPI000E3E47FD|nr:LysR family transcriptional regulator [Vibrio maerlii]
MRDLNALQVFLTLMQTHSTQRAALKLGRSQSYVSKVLAQLREDLDDPLFVRSVEGLSPTSYALSIEPKLRDAFDQVNLALNPEEFDPKQVDKVTLHIVEPYLIAIGKQIIETLRQETDAIIEMRIWSKLSENLIENEEVDLGLHILTDRSQVFYQRKLHNGSGFLDGNRNGEYVKFLISGVNDYTNHFQVLDDTIEPTLYVDNYALMNQLMETCYTLRYAPHHEDSQATELNLEVAMVLKSSRRNSPKMKWLQSVIEPIVNDLVGKWNAENKGKVHLG